MTKKKVLVVDDDALVRALVAQYLTYGGYEAIAAADGDSAIELYETEQPDLIVLDIAMPGMSGFDTADAIRQLQDELGRPRTPIVLLTAFARNFFVPAGHDQRIDSFMRKPVTRDEFLKHIRQFVADAPGPAET